ncbi:MAG: hypothetical protein JRI80_15965 [Deltaproteobacteria bacterium]|nr:hypothetical protein [Deltaproteobacteria bacterium]
MKKQPIKNHWWIARVCPDLVFLLGILFFQACAPPPSREIPVVRKDPFRSVPNIYARKARQMEKAQDLPMAIFCWRIVESFRPGDSQAKAELQRLSAQARAEAQKHYARGLKYFQDKKINAARDEMLKALFYTPDNHKALDFLENDLSPPEAIAYRVRKGDDPASIAKRLYHDPKKGFLVAYFSGTGNTSSPAPGELLNLPLIEPVPPVKKPRPVTSIQKAQALFRKKKYREAISLAENIVAYGPSPAARDIINGSYYALAMQEFRAGRLLEAGKLFTMVNRDYEQTSDYIRSIKNQLRVRADYHYKKGVQYFVDEKLAKAISEWEITLRLNPEHTRARAQLKKARTMLKNLNGLQ